MLWHRFVRFFRRSAILVGDVFDMFDVVDVVSGVMVDKVVAVKVVLVMAMVGWIVLVVLVVLIVGVVGVVGVILGRSLDSTRRRGKAIVVKKENVRRVVEVGKFVGGKRVVVGDVKIIGGVFVGGLVVPIVFVVVNGVVRAPFDDKTAVLKEWLAFMCRQGFEASDGRIRHWKGNPLVP